jgi:hypothetical protein
MAVCVECFDKLPTVDIVAITVRAYRTSCTLIAEEAGIAQVRMSPTEHLLVESAIKGWVRYMKGESTETPFDQQAVSL